MGAGLTDRQRETAEDRRFYVEIGFVPVRCASCGVEALVKKNSHKHTSVQWTAAGVAGWEKEVADNLRQREERDRLRRRAEEEETAQVG